MPTKREVIFGVGGFTAGVTVPKLVPKMQSVKAAKFWGEFFHAWFRLQKVCREEYYRVEEAIEAEMTLLGMIDPRNKWTNPLEYKFELKDDGLNRSVGFNIKTKKETEEGE